MKRSAWWPSTRGYKPRPASARKRGRREDCGQPAKHPFGRLVKNGVKDASKDPQTVARWFASTAFNIGIATGAVSGIFVLDINPRHGGDEALSALEAELGSLPASWRFLTGGAGSTSYSGIRVASYPIAPAQSVPASTGAVTAAP